MVSPLADVVGVSGGPQGADDDLDRPSQTFTDLYRPLQAVATVAAVEFIVWSESSALSGWLQWRDSCALARQLAVLSNERNTKADRDCDGERGNAQ